MNLPAILTGVLFILWGVNQTALLAVSGPVLGALAILTGILWIVSVFYPLTFRTRS